MKRPNFEPQPPNCTMEIHLPGTDAVNHPAHYNSHPSGIECITVTEHMNFNLGNAFKYIWRAGLKSEDQITDLKKAVWYLEREVARLKKLAEERK